MIKQLNLSNMEYAAQFLTLRELNVKEDKLINFLSDKKNLCYMKIIDDVVVGMIWGYILDRMDEEPMIFVYSVDVLPEFRRKGYAKEIMNEFIKLAKEQSFRNVFLLTDQDNQAGNHLYRSINGEELRDKVLYMYKRGEHY